MKNTPENVTMMYLPHLKKNNYKLTVKCCLLGSQRGDWKEINQTPSSYKIASWLNNFKEQCTTVKQKSCKVFAAFKRKSRLKMNSVVTISTADIILISLNVVTLLIVIVSYFKSHTGDCRGALVTKTKTPDGCVTREAKLSMHEAHELQSLRRDHWYCI